MIMANAPAIAGETAYGYLFGSKTGENGFVSFDIDNPQKLTVKNRVYSYIHPSAGEYVDGRIYTYQVELGEISGISSDTYTLSRNPTNR